jgi:early secretory antigenic target protein ESAT-6
VPTTGGLLDEDKGSLAALAAVWGGTGSEADQAVQMRWGSTSAELNSALHNLAVTISKSSATMAQTQAGATGMLA